MESEYTTLDLGEASVLAASGFDLLRLEPTQKKNQRAFVFTKLLNSDTATPNASDTVSNYRRKRCSIDAYTFFLATKELKSRLHDEIELSR